MTAREDPQTMELTTLELDVTEGVATVTLNRPDVYNAFDPAMTEELARVWRALRLDAAVRSVIVTAAGEKAFCTGIDRSAVEEYRFDALEYEDPGRLIGPKSQGLWKPVVAAVNGMACGGAFYLLGEADVIIAADHATFFDPHVTYSMVAAYEPILLLRRMPFSEVLRMAIVGNHERISAATAQKMGLVSEVTTADELQATARQLAEAIAAQPPLAVQATLRSLWAAKDMPGIQATDLGNLFLQLGTSDAALNAGEETFRTAARVKPRIR
ncbi:MAG TPA: enoyl-CoA hydratase/isomerase family protein [Microthrixaceae bacterium]|nr:enoyl-CoA hydratase/isomerase family protein [Microthrixaceae bacterium]